MSVLRLSIDTKSLFYNIKNDNQTGHTATVATPIKQGSSIRPELSMLLQIPESISLTSKENLIHRFYRTHVQKPKLTDCMFLIELR